MYLFTVSKRNKTHKIVRETIINQADRKTSSTDHLPGIASELIAARLEESRSRKGVDKEWKSPGGGNIEE